MIPRNQNDPHTIRCKATGQGYAGLPDAFNAGHEAPCTDKCIHVLTWLNEEDAKDVWGSQLTLTSLFLFQTNSDVCIDLWYFEPIFGRSEVVICRKASLGIATWIAILDIVWLSWNSWSEFVYRCSWKSTFAHMPLQRYHRHEDRPSTWHLRKCSICDQDQLALLCHLA